MDEEQGLPNQRLRRNSVSLDDGSPHPAERLHLYEVEFETAERASSTYDADWLEILLDRHLHCLSLLGVSTANLRNASDNANREALEELADLVEGELGEYVPYHAGQAIVLESALRGGDA